jgi:hypothetical protein
MTEVGHFRQIDTLPTVAAGPLRSDRAQIYATRLNDVKCHDPAYSRSNRSALPWQTLARTTSLIGAASMKAAAVCVSS